MSEPDNLILVLLRELRADMGAMGQRVDARFEQIETRFDVQFARMQAQLDELHTNGLKALQDLSGYRNRASFLPSVIPTASSSGERSETRGPLSGEAAAGDGR